MHSLDAPRGTHPVTALPPTCTEQGERLLLPLCKGTAGQVGSWLTWPSWETLTPFEEETAVFCHALFLRCNPGCMGICLARFLFFLPSEYLAFLLRVSLPSKVSEEIIPILIFPFNMVISDWNINWKFGKVSP